jgi:predicted CoA-binding protein
MSVENLDKIFQPKSIAVVGASERRGSVGAAIMHNLLAGGFSGEIHPINPKRKKSPDWRPGPRSGTLTARWIWQSW